VQAVVCRPPSCWLDEISRLMLFAPSKSMLAHDAVAAAVLHKHHPIIRVGAGLIQFVYLSHSRLATEFTRHRPVTEKHFRHFLREFF